MLRPSRMTGPIPHPRRHPAPPPAGVDRDEAFPGGGHAPAFADDGDEPRSPDPYGDAYADTDDTADLTVEYPIEDVAPEPNGPPKIHRKREGTHPADARHGQTPSPAARARRVP